MTIVQLKFYLLTCGVLVLTVDVVVCPAKAMNLQNHLVLFYLVGKRVKYSMLCTFLASSASLARQRCLLSLVLGDPIRLVHGC